MPLVLTRKVFNMACAVEYGYVSVSSAFSGNALHIFQSIMKPIYWYEDDYNVGEIIFHDKSPETKGSQIYHNIIAEPKAYITDQAHDVLETSLV